MAQNSYFHCNGTNVYSIDGYDGHFMDVPNCLRNVIDTVALPAGVMKKITTSLITRVGPEFYKRLSFEECHKMIVSDDPEKPCDENVTYALAYYFMVEGGMRYQFRVFIDREGTAVRPVPLPEVSSNKDFGKLIAGCEAIALAEKDKRYTGKISSITLEYNSKENTFVWEVIKDDNDKFVRFTIINAVTGKTIGYKKNKIRPMINPRYF